MKQLEFSFLAPFIKKEAVRTKAYELVLEKIFRGFKDFSSLDLSSQPMSGDERYSIPMSIYIGTERQKEFHFVKEIDKLAWKGFPIEYAYEQI